MGKEWKNSVVVVGGGHNGLTAAAYLARAGVSVTILERLPQFGGAAVSHRSFDGVDARLSRYSYLVSLLPKQIISDLGLSVSLARRRYSSYTPVPGSEKGLLIDNEDWNETEASFTRLGSTEDYPAWKSFYAETAELAAGFWPTVLEPLRRRSELKSELANPEVWDKFIERPLGDAISAAFLDDYVKGIVYTDALIGTFAPISDASFSANKCFLYHVIGGGTGEWNVPVGGMGAVSGSLEQAATGFGANLVPSAEVLEILTGSDSATVRYRVGSQESEIRAEYVLANVSATELARLLGEAQTTYSSENQKGAYQFGAQLKVNLLLSRLPRLKDQLVGPEAAFGGTFHINESFTQLQRAYDQAQRGEIPDPLPCEIYCHSLTDASILGMDLRNSGAQTLTVFALQAPHSLVSSLGETEHEAMRLKLQKGVLASLNSVLAEPIEELLLRDINGKPCIETKTTRDLETELRLPGGNIFHDPLSWPFAEDDEILETPAQRWGVTSSNSRVLICGSSARRGGAVSGISGHNAAMATLELLAP